MTIKITLKFILVLIQVPGVQPTHNLIWPLLWKMTHWNRKTVPKSPVPVKFTKVALKYYINDPKLTYWYSISWLEPIQISDMSLKIIAKTKYWYLELHFSCPLIRFRVQNLTNLKANQVHYVIINSLSWFKNIKKTVNRGSHVAWPFGSLRLTARLMKKNTYKSWSIWSLWFGFGRWSYTTLSTRFGLLGFRNLEIDGKSS